MNGFALDVGVKQKDGREKMIKEKEEKKEEIKKDGEQIIKIKHDRPNYAGDGIAVWQYQGKSGIKYLKISIVGHNIMTAFENIEKK